MLVVRGVGRRSRFVPPLRHVSRALTKDTTRQKRICVCPHGFSLYLLNHASGDIYIVVETKLITVSAVLCGSEYVILFVCVSGRTKTTHV